MADNNLAKTTVIGLPEGITNGEIRMTCCVEPGMGGAPTVTAVDERKLLQARQPLASAAVAQLGIGGVLTQAIPRFQGIDEVLLMVPAQPCGTAGLDQIPDQIHRCGNGLTTVDHIPAEDQMVVRRQRGEQMAQGLIAAMHVSNHPVPTAAQVQGNNLEMLRF